METWTSVFSVTGGWNLDPMAGFDNTCRSKALKIRHIPKEYWDYREGRVFYRGLVLDLVTLLTAGI